MAKNTFAFFGILAVLLLGIGIISAASGTVTENGITMDVNETALTDVTSGETYSFEVIITNDNGTAYNVSFGTSGWTWDKEGITIANGATETFVGTLTIGTTQSKSIIAKFYDMADSTSKLFEVKETVSLSYLPILGCIDPAANNTDPAANTDDGSCTYDPLAPGCTDDSYDNYDPDATEDDGTCANDPAPSTQTTLCEDEGFNELGDLEISDFDVNNNGEGKDDEWEYLDEIEIVVEIENTHNTEDVEDVEVMIIIMDNKIENGGNDVTDDFEFDDEILTSIGRLGDGKEEEVTFVIDELPSDLDDGTYYMYIMAYEDSNEDEQCESKDDELGDNDYYFKFTVESINYKDSVVARGTELETVIETDCGQQNLEILIPIYNLGDNDEEKVLVSIYNSELRINEYEVIKNLDEGDKSIVTFFVDIPEELSKEKYDLDVYVYFDWDEDEDDEDTTYYDEETSTSVRLNILSCRGPEPSINAKLNSAAEVGTDLIIKALVTNNGGDNDFVISVSGFESWADLVSVTPQTASIKEGEFTEITIILSPKTAGAQSFKINAIVDGESYDQSVSVNITEKPGLFGGMSDVVTYTIIAIIAILVLIFLVLIAKISRKSAKPQF